MEAGHDTITSSAVSGSPFRSQHGLVHAAYGQNPYSLGKSNSNSHNGSGSSVSNGLFSAADVLRMMDQVMMWTSCFHFFFTTALLLHCICYDILHLSAYMACEICESRYT